MTSVLTIGGTTYTMVEDKHNLTTTVDERQRLQCDVIDYSGLAHFVKGEQVVLTDPVLGILFNGVLNTDKEVPQYPSNAILHSIDCVDKGQYFAGKRTYTRTYDTSEPAGKLFVDQLHDVLAGEGIQTNYAEHFDTTATDFSTGILSNVVGASNVDDGDLELAKAGSDLTITANLSSGTLTNVTYSGGILAPTLTPAIKMSCSLQYVSGTNLVYTTIWTGSITLATNDTFVVTLWIPSGNPSFSATLNATFADGGDLNLGTEVGGVDIYDQNNLPSQTFTGSVLTDLSFYAKDQWYTRTFTFPSAYNGKIVTGVQVGMGGSSSGSYTAYYKNITLKGNTIFSSSLLTTPVIQRSQSFSTSTIMMSVVQCFDQTNCSYTSNSTSIDAIKLVRSSVIQWNATTPTPTSIRVFASLDGNSYLQCTNNASFLGLPAGSNVASTSLWFKLLFYSGPDPTIIPSITSLTATFLSAPAATKSDITTSFGTQTAWNTGTHSNTQALSNGTLTLTSLTRDWNDNLITNQTFNQANGCTQAASSGAYRITVPVRTSPPNASATSQFNFAGQVMDFTLEMDITNPFTTNFSSIAYLFYRQTQWDSNIGQNSYAYTFAFGQNVLALDVGTNDISGGSSTNLATSTVSLSSGTYHVKLVVAGSSHLVYFNNSSTPTFNITDNKIPAPGFVGVGGFIFQQATGGGSGTFVFDNLVLTPSPTGTWTGPSTSISSLGTCGPSAITWTEINTTNPTQASVSVQTSIDGGSTYQACVNGGAIPGLPSGTNVSGKSVIAQVVLNGISQPMQPYIEWLYWRVLGQYPGSSGTRSTAPLGNDMSITRTVGSGWGTAFDGQTWTQVGTATTAVATGEETITNTTGDVHMVLGSRTWTDEDGTMRVTISASTISPGMELRYTDANNYYRLSITTTSITITKKSAGFTNIIATQAATYTTGTEYRMRFRAVGSGPVNLYGKVWLDGQVEPGVTNGITSTTNPMWTIVGID
ncbi:MAG: hypothetical protein PVS3B3_17310 [Ktedonobacteraceae bacterium]